MGNDVYILVLLSRHMQYRFKDLNQKIVQAYIMERVTIESQSQCWVWTGPNQKGHGRIQGCISKWAGTKEAHRISYQVFVGDIPADKMIRHHCNNGLCCNPDHLKPGTALENALDRKEPIDQRSKAALLQLEAKLEQKIISLQAELACVRQELEER